MNIDEIVSKLDIKSFFSKYGVAIKKESNQNCEGSCPLCRDEKHFSFNWKNGLWKCWKCKESGNLVGFLRKLGHDYKNAKKILQEEAGITADDRVIPLGGRQKKTSKTPNKDAGKVIDKPVIYRIYTRVCELLPLTDIHRQQLKTKRGFTDETIDRLMFRSLGRHAAAIKDGLLAEFQEDDLVESGVLVKVNNQLIVNSQLLEDRVLIPYLGLARYVPTDGTGAVDDNNDAPGRPTGADSKNSTEAESASLRAGTSTTDGMGSEMVRQSEPGRPTGADSKNLGVKEEVEVYYIRPHKLGFERIAPQIYCRYFLQKLRPEHVVLTEGEFKAAALWQWRIPAVAVPGISSFGVKHLDRLVALFREFGVKKVTVIFDNEIKDNPEYPNYKPKASDRYDTQLWSYLMAYKLGREGFDARVGWLPDEWREKGKIDFDGALAQGRTREEILNVIARAKPPREFLEDLDEEARRIVQRKISQHFTRLNIRREFNRYVVTRYRGKDVYDETISNFVINIRSSYFTPEGVFRNIQLVNEYGETSDFFTLEPSSMAGLNEFKKFCFAAGNYVFEGSSEDLINIWKLEFGRDSGELIVMPEKIGIVKKGLWLFGSMAIAGKNKMFRPDNEQVFWIDGKGYKPRSLTVEKEKF
ncbi:MAG TPA: CHC2 zinc finger domain-containing protein [Bacillota bacterium]|nr:CHC2 zinc finger domain-containing protein [Bacillota bacterium]